MRGIVIGATLMTIGLMVYLGIVAWMLLGGHADEPLTGAQGTFWTLGVFGPLLLGIGVLIGAASGGGR